MKKLTFNRMKKKADDLQQIIDAQEKQIADLLDYNARNALDIKAYNEVIDGMIAGNSPCPMCEEYDSCEKAEKGKGCGEWMLTWKVQENVGKEISGDDGEAVSATGDNSGTGTENTESTAGTL